MALLASINSGSSLSHSRVQRAREGMSVADPLKKVSHLVGKGVLMHSATHTTNALVATKNAAQVNELKVHAMRGQNVIAQMEAIAQEKLSLIAEQQRNISLGKAIDPALADRFDALTTQQQRLCLEYKVAGKRVLADPAVAADAENRKFTISMGDTFQTIDMPTVDMSLMYANTRAVRQAFDETLFFDAQMVVGAKNDAAAAAAAGGGEAAKIAAAVQKVIDAIAGDATVANATLATLNDNLWQGSSAFYATYNAGATRFVVGGANIDTIDALKSLIQRQVNGAVSDFQRAKYTEMLDIVKANNADINAASLGAFACLNAAHQSFEALRASVAGGAVVAAIDAAATYANLEPMIEFVQQNVTVLAVNSIAPPPLPATPSVLSIAVNSPIWEHGQAGGGGGGEFDEYYLSQDMINRVLGFTLPEIDGVAKLIDNNGDNVGNACSLRSAEQVKVALLAEPQVMRHLSTVREKMANLVSDLGGVETRRSELSARLNDCIAEISALDATALQSEINDAAQRQFSAAYAISTVFDDNDDLLVSLNS